MWHCQTRWSTACSARLGTSRGLLAARSSLPMLNLLLKKNIYWKIKWKLNKLLEILITKCFWQHPRSKMVKSNNFRTSLKNLILAIFEIFNITFGVCQLMFPLMSRTDKMLTLNWSHSTISECDLLRISISLVCDWHWRRFTMKAQEQISIPWQILKITRILVSHEFHDGEISDHIIFRRGRCQ